MKKKKWSEHTNILCWWCTLQFDNIPIAIPYKIKNNIFHVFGCFRSFSCALSYNIHSKNFDIWERCSLLHLLYKKMTNSYINIIPAPPKEIMIRYGGYITSEEYVKNLLKIKKSFSILIPPIISIIPQIEEVNFKNSIYSNLAITQENNDDNLKTNDGGFKLRRDKTMLGKNTLEKCMGVKTS